MPASPMRDSATIEISTKVAADTLQVAAVFIAFKKSSYPASPNMMAKTAEESRITWEGRSRRRGARHDRGTAPWRAWLHVWQWHQVQRRQRLVCASCEGGRVAHA